MRRTNEEFKAELEKRCRAYRHERARKRRNLLTAALCVSICCVAVAVFDPFGAASEAPRAADTMKNESVMQFVGAGDLKPESNLEYSYFSGATGADAAAPMEEPGADGLVTDEPAEEPRAEADETLSMDVSVSTRSAANSWPLNGEDALEVLGYLRADGWTEGSTRCLMDCKLYANGMIYEYSSRCGVIYDSESNQSLPLDDAQHFAFNELLQDYIPLDTAQMPAITVTCGSEQITLDETDSAVILEYLCADGWIMSAANCLCDYTLEVNGETYRYHSDCGTVQDESGYSLALSEEQKEIFNEILARCPMRIE